MQKNRIGNIRSCFDCISDDLSVGGPILDVGPGVVVRTGGEELTYYRKLDLRYVLANANELLESVTVVLTGSHNESRLGEVVSSLSLEVPVACVALGNNDLNEQGLTVCLNKSRFLIVRNGDLGALNDMTHPHYLGSGDIEPHLVLNYDCGTVLANEHSADTVTLRLDRGTAVGTSG